MFYLTYLRNELVRRRGRTILTLLGLALGIALVIAITALSRGLDRAQETALDPLSSIGTDLTVTRDPQQTGGFGGGREIFAANRQVLTDLSKLGKAGDRFVHDFFLPGAQLTFPQGETRQLASLPGVAEVAPGLTLLAVHQEGTVPKIVARFRTGGQQLRIDREIPRLTPAEIAKVQACVEKAQGGQGRSVQPEPGGLRSGGEDERGLRFGPLPQCLPERLRRFRATITTPEETFRQVLSPPQTDIESEPYTIAGVDPARPGIGLVTPAQVTSGRFLGRKGGREALVSAAYAASHRLKLGAKLNLNGARFRIVGIVEPPLGGQAADVYLPLARLQQLAGLKGMANVALVRATDGSSVAGVQRGIEQRFAGAQVASAQQVADRITGSLVDAASLSRNLGLVLAVLAAAAAFLLAALLTLSSVGKRVRELGTLKAIGWTQGLVVRQVVGESLAQGIAGGLLGIGAGLAAAAAIDAFGPTLTASSTSGGEGLFGLGEVAARTTTSAIPLDAPVSASLLLIGLVLALAGGVIAGAAGALRAARLRPADALRQLE